MRELAIDIETYSDVDLRKSSVYKYVESPNFEILLFAYRFTGEKTKIVDLANGEILPREILDALQDPGTVKTAHNAQFERLCIQRHLGKIFATSPHKNTTLPIEQWQCTMTKAAMLGLPLDLERVGKILGTNAQKDSAGKGLIRYFCIPCKPTAANGMRTRNLPNDDPEKWSQFKAYCVTDVDTECAIKDLTRFYHVPENELKLYVLDQKINDTGILLDVPFAENAIEIDKTHKARLFQKAVELTGLSNPNSTRQLLEWIKRPHMSLEETNPEDIPVYGAHLAKTPDEIKIDNLQKETVTKILKEIPDGPMKQILELRQEMSKTSIRKYVAMINSYCADNRIRGLVQFYGANRTGRWAGRIVQVQNLPRILKWFKKWLNVARNAVLDADLEYLIMMFASVPDTLSQLIRTAFIAAEGKTFVIADFSAIEARVIAWLAGEQWRLDVFNLNGDIYIVSAGKIFKIPEDQIDDDMRQKGKVFELSCGFGGGLDAAIRMGALEAGLKKSEISEMVKAWRKESPAIVQYWRDVEKAAIQAVMTNTRTSVRNVSFFMDNGILFIELPSKRCLAYYKPIIKKSIRVFFQHFVVMPADDYRFSEKVKGQLAFLPVAEAMKLEAAGKGVITSEEKEVKTLYYQGTDQDTKQWQLVSTYGGKLVENIVQGVARDCLAEKMLHVDKEGICIVGHVHDEIITEVPEKQGSHYVNMLNTIMRTPISWAAGLPLNAESFETKFYKKD